MYDLTYSSTHEVLTKVLSGMTGTGRWRAELKSSNGRSRFPYLALTVVKSDHTRLLLDALFSLTLWDASFESLKRSPRQQQELKPLK